QSIEGERKKTGWYQWLQNVSNATFNEVVCQQAEKSRLVCGLEVEPDADQGTVQRLLHGKDPVSLLVAEPEVEVVVSTGQSEVRQRFPIQTERSCVLGVGAD